MAYRWQTSEFAELDTNHLYAALRLRQQVFAVEQDCAYLDLDNMDQSAIHMLCWQEDQLLAYQRCLAPDKTFAESALGRIVVSPEARGHQLGKELVQRGISHNLKRWPAQNIRIHAQAHLQDFYHSLGFTAEGELFDEDGIPHIQMVHHHSD